MGANCSISWGSITKHKLKVARPTARAGVEFLFDLLFGSIAARILAFYLAIR
jgi:hypothetical protein